MYLYYSLSVLFSVFCQKMRPSAKFKHRRTWILWRNRNRWRIYNIDLVGNRENLGRGEFLSQKRRKVETLDLDGQDMVSSSKQVRGRWYGFGFWSHDVFHQVMYYAFSTKMTKLRFLRTSGRRQGLIITKWIFSKVLFRSIGCV